MSNNTNYLNSTTIKSRLFILLIVFSFLISGCSTYYRKNYDLMQAVYTGNLNKAEGLMKDKKWAKPKRNRLLFYLNKGTVLWMNGKNTESNLYFQKADYFVEDFRKNYAQSFVSLFTNPSYTTYNGETFEQVLIHYYASMNFIQMGDYDNALVACKRMIASSQRIDDLYKGKNKYKRDAFAHNILGMIYDAQKDYNNAFIAYRNAYTIYVEDYLPQLGTEVPLQLKKDLIRTAKLIGFSEEVNQYETLFKMKFEPVPEGTAPLVFFWNNGLGPIKDENSINFVAMPLQDGWVDFVNLDLGLHFPIYVGNDGDRRSISALKVVRVAWPKYISRIPLYNKAQLVDSLNNKYDLQMAENVNAIAFKSLEDRMLKEIGEAILRLALKQAAELAARNQNQGAGLAVGLLNAFTEQADTRNWQLLPYSINYTRVNLPLGPQNIKLLTSNKDSSETNDFFVNIKKGETNFQAFQTLQFTGYADKAGNMINRFD